MLRKYRNLVNNSTMPIITGNKKEKRVAANSSDFAAGATAA
ncbi:hypothetical protein BBG19_0008 [Francisella sp. MA067296]|nr:hypothetical protein BBG19_0008 [Francisella sp. MA067296]